MKAITSKFRQIDWKSGNASMLMCVFFAIAGLVMMILVMEYGNVYSIGAVSQTRADAIADSTAVYAVSYDSTYNRRAAYEQGTMLTAYNSGERTPIASEIQVLPDDAGKNTKLEVKVAAQGHFFFPGYAGAEIFEVTRESAVEVVDMSGGVIIIP